MPYKFVSTQALHMGCEDWHGVHTDCAKGSSSGAASDAVNGAAHRISITTSAPVSQ
jgi:hypothetical protein